MNVLRLGIVRLLKRSVYSGGSQSHSMPQNREDRGVRQDSPSAFIQAILDAEGLTLAQLRRSYAAR